MAKLFLFLLIASTVVLVEPAYAQSKPETKHSMKKKQKAAEKKQRQQKDEQVDVAEELRVRHQKNQTKAVKKRMKKSQKKAKRTNNNRGEFFLTKWGRNMGIWFKSVFRKKNKT